MSSKELTPHATKIIVAKARLYAAMERPAAWIGADRSAHPNIGVIQTVLICSAGLAILAVAATLNRHVRNARPLGEVENQLLMNISQFDY